MNDFTSEEEKEMDDNHWMNITISVCVIECVTAILYTTLHVLGVVG